MKDFFKTFGLGLLYVILLPFLVVYLALLGIYLFFKNFVWIFLFKNKKYKAQIYENEEQAQKILEKNRYKEEAPATNTETVIEKSEDKNVTYNTTNNIIITGMDYKTAQKKLAEDPSYFEKLSHNQNKGYIESHDVSDDFYLEHKNETTLEDDDPDELNEAIKESIKEERVDMSLLKRED